MKNKNGFTLIEIIVSLLIASIGMVIATTLILNSMGYFNKTAISDHDKQALDGIKEYFHDELIYASEARIATEKPDQSNWHWLYVKDGVLYRDDNYGYNGDIILEDIAVYNMDYYNSRILNITARTFGSYRIDLKFSFSDKKDVVYKTSTTIEMLNFGKNISGGVASLKDDSQVLDGINKLYYKKDSLNYEKAEAETYTGTVADQVGCIPEEILNDDEEKYKFISGTKYKAGDFRYILVNDVKIWYMCLLDSRYNDQELEGQDRYGWKKLVKEYTPQSAYLAGDVVVYQGIYYECLTDRINNGSGDIWTPGYQNENWKKISTPTKANKKCGILKIDNLPSEGTVARQNFTGGVQKFEKEKFYNVGVLATEGNNYSPIKSLVWKKVKTDLIDSDLSKFGERNANGQLTWRDFSLDWQVYNGYLKNDVIRFDDDNYYRALDIITDGTPPVDANGKVSDKWQRVKISGSGTNSIWVIDDSK